MTLGQDTTSQRSLTGPDGYPTWSALRNMLFDLHQNLAHAPDIQPEVMEIFERMLLVAHYYATRSALMTSSQDLREVGLLRTAE